MVQPTRVTVADWREAGGKVRRAVRRRRHPAHPAPRARTAAQRSSREPTPHTILHQYIHF